MVKDCVSCNCVLWNCDRYTLTYICVTALYLGVSMFVYQSSLSLAIQLRLEVIPINCKGDIVAIMLDLRTLLSVSSTCATALPADSVDFSSFVAFKRTVQQIDFTSFLSC